PSSLAKVPVSCSSWPAPIEMTDSSTGRSIGSNSVTGPRSDALSRSTWPTPEYRLVSTPPSAPSETRSLFQLAFASPEMALRLPTTGTSMPWNPYVAGSSSSGSAVCSTRYGTSKSAPSPPTLAMVPNAREYTPGSSPSIPAELASDSIWPTVTLASTSGTWTGRGRPLDTSALNDTHVSDY